MSQTESSSGAIDACENHISSGVYHEGLLNKWTNYIHGWQSRWMVLSNGVLSYYKSQRDRSVGCRGAISIQSARVRPHQFDDCRLDVCVGDSVWYLRAQFKDQRSQWIDVIERARSDVGCSPHQPGPPQPLSSGSARWLQDFSDKLTELTTYRSLMVGQLDRLQCYFDSWAPPVALSGVKQRISTDQPRRTHSRHLSLDTRIPTLSAVDFRGEAITFKATSSSALETLQMCIDAIAEREGVWRTHLQREEERCRQLTELLAHRAGSGDKDDDSDGKLFTVSRGLSNSVSSRFNLLGGPDFQEGPHSSIGEDEFFDAVETALDRIQDDQELTDWLRRHNAASECTENSTPVSDDAHDRRKKLLEEVKLVTSQQLHYALSGVEQGVWTLFASDGDMKMYKREEEIDGLAVDPLKAVHIVNGVTAREVCWHFWSHEVRLDWETTVERVTILETIDDETVINLQLHKRVWPAAQRDSLFWSHIESDRKDEHGQSWTIVVNKSTEHDSEAARRSASNSNLVRVHLTACMACRDEVVGDGVAGGVTLSRDRLRTHIIYCAVINPGGWAPTSALRLVYKREFPRFLKRFTEYVVDKCKGRPIQW